MKTLEEIKQKANEIAKPYGIENDNVTVMASIFSLRNGKKHFSYTIQVWSKKFSKHISNKSASNPESALQAFKDALEFAFKEYDNKSEDIEI